MSRPLTVMQLGAFPFPLPQGSQVYVAGMARALARRGHRVLLAAYGHGRGPWPEGVERASLPPIPGIGGYASGPHPSKVPLDAMLAAWVAWRLRRDSVDVVHAHNVEAPLVAALARVLARRRVPLVYNLHTSLEEELPTYWTAGWRGRIAGPLGRAVDRALPKLADVCVALSARAEEQLRDWGAQDVVRIGPGVDVDEVQGGDAAKARARWSLGDGAWVVYTGNADAYQDLDVLVRAMVEVPEAGLLIVSSSDLTSLGAVADAAGLGASRRRFVRSEAFDDTKDALAAATVLALPRAVCTGFPIKLLNGLAAGRVTVAARGSAQAIEGVVPVPNRNPGAMAAALRSVINAPAMRARLGDAARRSVAAQHGWDARAEELEALYARCVRRR